MKERSEIEQLYRQHGTALVLFATAIAGCRGRGQDSVHKVFLKLLEKGLNSRVTDVKAYLFSSVRNTVLNDIKRTGRAVELNPDIAWFEPPERDYAVERQLQLAITELPEDQRQIVAMHIWGDLTFLQISEVLNISANTAASRYRYALTRLQEYLSTREGCHV